MAKKTNEELNAAAMQMILFAGNSRNMITEALQGIENGMDSATVKAKLKEAKDEITKAHKIQTDMIQSTIEEDEVGTTLLFTHAQDTLMTIYSELNMAKHMTKLFYLLKEQVCA